ncbi:putative lipid II flippase FtsW [Marinibactrum halimedae]|uniref:Probable peptidoglycan glycosyltransferase FtsW n=1 Tax=Marinibactrum halimedae TaxID=1444977 RepID=A0AA37WLF3_9GAMM|nr:putative lipid II flippase FtsW [Marinibactrum halimedae]MCD9459604.1 putative lipid II flippase FtsW [Marinibactrum halimedae]GLS25578.1 putative lipid II flippase FtsW [Marinibactrum halimedae]
MNFPSAPMKIDRTAPAVEQGYFLRRIGDVYDALSVDPMLVIVISALVSFGIVMVASSSISFADHAYGDPWFFLRKHLVYLLIGLTGAVVIGAIPLSLWRQYGWVMLVGAVILLALVLVPGLGKSVNGSQRWLRLGPINIQASEVAKFCCVIFFASYFSKWQFKVSQNWRGVVKPLGVLMVVAFLILLEPDFGSTFVLVTTVLAMMFIAGIKLWQCLLLGLMAGGGFAALAVLTPWRLKRLQTFLNPWADQFDSGYQLTQSLIGFGRGEWFGMGLGNSIQKLFFLPEAHTDFIFSIIAEEFGLIGSLLVMGLFVVFIVKAFVLSRQAINRDNSFASYAAFGIGVMFAAQVIINVGVASGFLPTKGLTLPFISYGGSSLVVCCLFVGLLLRIQKELQPTLTPVLGAKT